MLAQRFNFAAQCWKDGHFLRDIVVGGVLNSLHDSFKTMVPDAIAHFTGGMKEGAVQALVTGNPAPLASGLIAASARLATPFAAAVAGLPAAAIVGVMGKAAGFAKNIVMGPDKGVAAPAPAPSLAAVPA